MQQFISQLIAHFKGRNVKNCITSCSDSLTLLEDNKAEGKTIFSTITDELYIKQSCFSIHNPTNKAINLWAIDGCFTGKGKPLSNKYPKKCDAAFGYEGYIAFIEFKLDAESSANPKTIETNRTTALQQIGNTLLFLKESLQIEGSYFVIEGYTIVAFLCTPPDYPKFSATNTDEAAAFLEKYGVSLFDVNETAI